VDHKAAHLARSECRDFNFYCTSNAIDENDDDDDDNVEAVMRMGMFGVSVRKMKALTVKILTKIGKGGYNLIFFVY
jgi:hypothetical protein